MQTKDKIRQFIGNKSFYKMTFALIIPIIIQQIILSISGYIDNLMINKFSEAAYNGVSSLNRLTFVILFFSIGISSGISIFLAQYLGAGKKEKIAGIIQLGLILNLIFGIIVSLLIYFIGPYVVKLYLLKSNSTLDEIKAISYGIEYSKYLSLCGILLVSNFMITTIFRTLKKPKYAMIAGIIGVLFNIFFNYVLIFGNLGASKMGAKGAAVATVIAKFIEFVILIVFAIIFDKEKYIFLIFKKNYMNLYMLKMYIKKSSFIIFNEVVWALVMSFYAFLITRQNQLWYQVYSYSQNICDLFFVFISGLATGAAILVGENLGNDDFTKAKDYARKLIGLSIILSIIMMIMLILIGPLFLLIFASSINNIFYTSYYLIIITAIILPFYSFNACIYFILRSGGDALKAFLLDEIPSLFIGIPILVIIYNYNYDFHFSIIYTLIISKIVDLIKVFYSIYFYKTNGWVKNIIKADIL